MIFLQYFNIYTLKYVLVVLQQYMLCSTFKYENIVITMFQSIDLALWDT